MAIYIEQRQQRIDSKIWPFTLLFIFQALIAGILFSKVDWATLFTANLPIGVVAIFIAVGQPARITAVSTLLGALSALSLLVALTCWSERGMGDARTHLSNGLAAILALLFLLNEKYGSQPWLPKALRRQTGFSWGLAAEVLSTTGIATGLFLTVVATKALYTHGVTFETGLFPVALTSFLLFQRLMVIKKGSNREISQRIYLPYVLPLRALGAAVGISLAVFLLTSDSDAEGYAAASALLLLLALGSTTATLVAADTQDN